MPKAAPTAVSGRSFTYSRTLLSSSRRESSSSGIDCASMLRAMSAPSDARQQPRDYVARDHGGRERAERILLNEAPRLRLRLLEPRLRLGGDPGDVLHPLFD